MRGHELQLAEDSCHIVNHVAGTNLNNTHGVPGIHTELFICLLLLFGTHDKRCTLNIPEGLRVV